MRRPKNVSQAKRVMIFRTRDAFESPASIRRPIEYGSVAPIIKRNSGKIQSWKRKPAHSTWLQNWATTSSMILLGHRAPIASRKLAPPIIQNISKPRRASMESTLSFGDIFAVATVLIPRMYHGFIMDFVAFTVLNCHPMALPSTDERHCQTWQAAMH